MSVQMALSNELFDEHFAVGSEGEDLGLLVEEVNSHHLAQSEATLRP